MTITDADVQLLTNTKTQTVRRNDVALAFLDDKELVLQDARGGELAREKHDELSSGAAKFGPAFRLHGYAWSDVREFRLEINKLGYAVRDDDGKQFVRAVGKP